MTPRFDTSLALSALPSIRHGFFGREGGVSVGDNATLNLSQNSGDDPAFVTENRRRALAATGAPDAALIIIRQTHSSTAQTVTSAPVIGTEGDALVTRTPGLALGILTADCTPILLADPTTGIIGAAHAGWKGAASGIASAVVLAMVDLGASLENIVAAIGPTISVANYEVGNNFRADFLAAQPDAAAFFSEAYGNTVHFDLPAYVASQLRGAGVTTIDNLDLCTYARPDRFFSHRYATHQGTGAGRQLAVITLAP
ncbi:MAG: pgeF [Devosia sp.]|nr:pgeF [Devosia sp.]